MTTSPAAGRQAPPGTRELFLAFLVLGLSGFGGIMPFARRTIVQRHHWLTPDEFAETLALCQFLPGGNIINTSVIIGRRFRGFRGAVAAPTGLLAGPTVIIVAVWSFYAAFAAHPLVEGAMLGLAAGASGLLAGMALRLLLPLRTRPAAAGIAVLVCLAVWLLGAPLIVVLLVATPLAMLLVRPEES